MKDLQELDDDLLKNKKIDDIDQDEPFIKEVVEYNEGGDLINDISADEIKKEE